MTKLVIAPPGQWQRSNGDVVEISSMIFHHLHHALRIVVEKHVESSRTLTRIKGLQARHNTTDIDQARAAVAEVEALIAALEVKRGELNAEISRRPAQVAP